MKRSVFKQMVAEKSDGKLTGPDSLTDWILEGIRDADTVGDFTRHIECTIYELNKAKEAVKDLSPDMPILADQLQDKILAQFAEITDEDLNTYLALSSSP